VEEINIGGGYPSQSLIKTTLPGLVLSVAGLKYKTQATPIEEFGERVSSRFAREVKILKHKPVLVCQPGRSVVSSMGIGVSRVVSVKPNWVFLDISNNVLPVSLFFAQREVLIANKVGRKATEKFNISGSSLNSADVLATNQSLPDVVAGDICVIMDAGAYTISRASRFATLSPAVFLIREKGKIDLIRRKETYEDVASCMEF